MTTSAILKFPVGQQVYVTALCNAGYTQTVTITSPTGSQASWSGSGENNTSMPISNYGFLSGGPGATPGTQPNFTAVAGNYTVTVSAGGKASSVMSSGVQIQPGNGSSMNMTFVVSDDSAQDGDWNDAIVEFTWFVPA